VSSFDPEGRIHLTILHFNDVYEITPVSGGALGGLARVAALRQQLLAANPNTLVTFGGDLYGPAGLAAAVVEGERLDGKQTVAVMNALGVDYMTLGDHELNTITSAQFLARLAETRFTIVSSNICAPDGRPFAAAASTVLEHDCFVVTNAQGKQMRVGIFGLTKPIRLPQVAHTYVDPLVAAADQVAALRDEVDLLIALTHQPLADDQALVQRFPQIDLVLGGDDHAQMRVVTGPGLAPIYKADSNARSVCIIDLWVDPTTGALRIADRVQPITATLPNEPITLAEIARWVDAGFATFRAEGWEPSAVVAHASTALDGFETAVRSHRTAFTDLITAGMQKAAPATELAIICSWAVRLDDCIPAGGTITQYDILRTFSYGCSPVYAVQTPGSLLAEILDFGQRKIGSGSYLLTTANVAWLDGGWQIDGIALNDQRPYLVAMADDLLHDYLFYINEARAPEVRVVGTYCDIGQAFIAQLQDSS